MKTLLRASSPADMLGMIPALAGFTPHNSLVLVPFHERRASGAMRVDLPRGDISLDEYVAHITGLLCRVSAVDGVAIAVYDDAPLGQGTPPWFELVIALCDRASECGISVFEALCVGTDAWADYLLDPHERHDLDAIEIPLKEGEVPAVASDHHVGAKLPDVSPATESAVRAAYTSMSAILDERLAGAGVEQESDDPQALSAITALDDLPDFFERMLQTPAPSPYELAALAWCLSQPALSDVALVQWAGTREDGDRALGARVVSCSRENDSDAAVLVLLGQAARPSAIRLQDALDVVREIAACLDDDDNAGPLAAAAWLSWALGRCTHATEYARQALVISPADPTAQLVMTLMETTALPAWAFERPVSTT